MYRDRLKLYEHVHYTKYYLHIYLSKLKRDEIYHLHIHKEVADENQEEFCKRSNNIIYCFIKVNFYEIEFCSILFYEKKSR